MIVEGPTDRTAWERIIRSVCEPEQLIVKIIHGDITSERNSNPSNIINKVREAIQNCLRENHLKKGDVSEVIHIVDTDGTFISSDCVHEGSKTEYQLDCILTDNVEGIIERNIKKSANIMKLMSLGKISQWKYSMYFMSVNLDHVLYDKKNLSDREKEELAYQFEDKYYDDIDGAIEYLCRSSFSICGSYMDSWKFIQKKWIRWIDIQISVFLLKTKLIKKKSRIKTIKKLYIWKDIKFQREKLFFIPANPYMLTCLLDTGIFYENTQIKWMNCE